MIPTYKNKKFIDEINFFDKIVLLRVDFNVPILNGHITSTKRIIASLKTIKKITNDGGRLVILSHLGRIKTKDDLEKKSLRLVAEKLEQISGLDIKFIPYNRGQEVENAIQKLENGQILLLENTRFQDLNNKAESKNDPELGKYWASLGDIFINDAFGTLHRAHASNVGIATYIQESGIGYLVKEELDSLSKLIFAPKKPFYAIIGGAKISDKIGIISTLLEKADKVLIGGGMGYTFKKALGYKIGLSICEDDKLKLALDLMQKYPDKLVLPLDAALAPEFKDVEPIYNEENPLEIPDHLEGMDIGPLTIKLFEDQLKDAKTVLWNGTLGVAEFKNFANGTREVAKIIAKIPNCYSVIGGGDSVAAIEAENLTKSFSHISTGGGASISFIEKGDLIGLGPIQEKDDNKPKTL
ncbi:phosphoglycerate kinase [Mycoplasma flocculare]|uniref:Phosphoglycerate kinase n=2 Tax=Mesomycoplasma flocculare TaxID=2128 RepID=A0A0A8E7Z7_MESFC|nr:phosphoglycerate kinase [Mesomycoplasma flocculare]MXR39371.1 phosphoglycerate kinase [Mycoplasma sp. MF12]AJC49742.1 phosphoglycerate kinase [Mesomycoplasma flocculare ATCC 27399]ENX50736.1 phosphoglycerate kinase [Mesomycoplasma flocculare ATCC 27716]MXR05785.1 phosphoglycerate kinase [Mesomycoplasma flocculare]MXR12155.1 phosphoglycerate kinase [Mesomycoplasma flocculare]